MESAVLATIISMYYYSSFHHARECFIFILAWKSKRVYTSIRLLNIVNESCTIRLPDNTHHLSHTRSNYHSFKHSNTYTNVNSERTHGYRRMHIELWLYYMFINTHLWAFVKAYHTLCCFCFYHTALRVNGWSVSLCSADMCTCAFISLSMIAESNRPVLARTHKPCTFAHIHMPYKQMRILSIFPFGR